MDKAFIVFPHQLFEHSIAMQKSCTIVLVEEFLFFRQYNFHKQKLVLHRASMKSYQSWLVKNGFRVVYIDSADERSAIKKLVNWLSGEGCTEIHYSDVTDYLLEKNLRSSAEKLAMSLFMSASPGFLNELKEVNSYFDKKKKYFQTAFYIDQRKQRKILVDDKLQPAGGEWSYDSYNRSKFPKNEKVPPLASAPEDEFVQEARAYVEKHFKDNYGSVEHFIYPTNFIEAKKWLEVFFQNRFEKFGIYEDAIVAEESFLYHAVLSPMMNIGLLTPKYIIENALLFAEKYEVPLNSLEGFIRQIMGWREFIRIVYEREGTKQRTKNYWGFKRPIPAVFWTGETGIAPIDNVIKKVLKTGYCHHIERLMVAGNFMLLCEFDPDEVYKWFMELFVDSYDWVMVPNVYGMTQFADGGLMTTKPYISGSNYILKMSDHKKGDWTEIWDGLFWRFMDVHRDFFSSNPRIGMLVKTYDKMPDQKKLKFREDAESFLDKLDGLNTKVAVV